MLVQIVPYNIFVACFTTEKVRNVLNTNRDLIFVFFGFIPSGICSKSETSCMNELIKGSFYTFEFLFILQYYVLQYLCSNNLLQGVSYENGRFWENHI